MSLNVGDKAPNFDLLTDQNQPLSLSQLAGKWIILYFYPKDNTPGCTQEAKDFKALIADYHNADAVILGVSKDSVSSHQKFKQKYDLPFHLLADPEVSLCKAYGVYVEKSLFGKKYFGIERTTFLIDPQGMIEEIWRKVKIKNHANTVLSKLIEHTP